MDPMCHQNAALNPGGLRVLLNDAGAVCLPARLQPELQRSLHLGSAGDGGVQLQAGGSGGAEAEAVCSSLGEQEDACSPGTLGPGCRHLGKKRKMHVGNARLVLMSKTSH